MPRTRCLYRRAILVRDGPMGHYNSRGLNSVQPVDVLVEPVEVEAVAGAGAIPGAFTVTKVP